MLRQWLDKKLHPRTSSSEAYISWLRKQGLDIGDGCFFWDPKSLMIDVQRPHMLHIGNYVKITSGVVILVHDYSRSTVFQATGSHVADCGATYIGDNVFIGMRSIVLMGTHIGSNCIVGAGSVVSGCFDDGLVIAGNPARIICTVEELAEKRRAKERAGAIEYACNWFEHFGRWPNINEMTNAFAWLYLPRTKETIENHAELFALNGIDRAEFACAFEKTTPTWTSFEAFIDECMMQNGDRGGLTTSGLGK